ncbi:hypothetical protein IAQ61_002178 [Plenodomus lingam]|uniref:Predicted protein n=1 Tax=Leptosphaeria maculans (strain JN3 / isolate v23.1.3 / race Av1-4-5-6-7-8) TaxID=985895 RepID=E4ZHB9_LEPMJ|nr:predicted protein [Plenodomus lingam JN3]KAH9876817.1 hypothetical protein IAQ61_002178 [Plenodomus lingam]CBX90689.1 predicted protein [Plenodomus lingam JN3]
MHATTALLPLFALAASILAAPAARRPVIRSVPDINMEIRNPMPIDGRGAIGAIFEGDLPKAIHHIFSRAAPVLENALENPVDVVERAVPSVHKTLENPVDVKQ